MLPEVMLTLVSKQSFPQQPLGSLQNPAFDEIRLPGDQHFANVVRMIEQKTGCFIKRNCAISP